jgi:hypothetical protein
MGSGMGSGNGAGSGVHRPGSVPPARPGYGSDNQTGNLNGARYGSASINRNWTKTVNINAVNVRPGWARPIWGIGSLATAAAIHNAVNAAIAEQTTAIVVPESTYQLIYGSVQPTGSATIGFAVTANGNTYQLTADCSSGLLNGEDPASAAEAQLLNAACQVAFGNA